MKNKLSYELACKIFKYHSNGKLTWKMKYKRNHVIGQECGHIDSNGYRTIGVDYKKFRRSRIVWLLHHGYIPEQSIDHINRVKTDDRIENLRLITPQCNYRNCDNHSHNISGIKGISWDLDRAQWVVQIKIMKKRKFIGRFDNFFEAVLHRLAAEQCLDWDGCDSSSPAYNYALKKNLIKR